MPRVTAYVATLRTTALPRLLEPEPLFPVVHAHMLRPLDPTGPNLPLEVSAAKTFQRHCGRSGPFNQLSQEVPHERGHGVAHAMQDKCAAMGLSERASRGSRNGEKQEEDGQRAEARESNRRQMLERSIAGRKTKTRGREQWLA